MIQKWLKWLKVLPAAIFAVMTLAGCENYVVLQPKGPVAKTEYDLIVFTSLVCLGIILVVFALLFYIIWRYRDKPDNKAPYQPEWDDNKTLEIVWWSIPIVICLILGYSTAKTTYALAKGTGLHDSNKQAVTIQATSLDWKWLFTYPDDKVASVNEVVIPAGVPVKFELTSDAPMNSFWVPSLGGQIYTMPGMSMGLYLKADKPGVYYGSGANFSGEGFAHMKFKVIAKPENEYKQWVAQVKKSSPALTEKGYETLSKPGLTDKAFYSSYPNGLFEKIVKKNGGDFYKMHHMDTYKTHPDFGKDSEKDENGGSDMNMDMSH
ncbi:cytochrome c oxidase subunit II [Bacillus sp. FSL W8-0116]|uniref:cytochrome c oxidase subunit II n=1 Tax=Bacillus sp. FSL W8-0116 TaxID=2978206 RepID=UPI0030F7F3E0